MPGKKILMIVDDDKDDRFFFRRAVKQINADYEVTEAQHGEEALEQLRKADQLPHYIFLDLNMPLMNGKECLAEIKKDEKLKNIPVIIYTTSTYKIDREITNKLGAAYFLTKPTDMNHLPGEIIKAINKVEEITGS